MIWIYPYIAGSASVKNLREAMPDLRIIRKDASRFTGNEKKIVINWGCSVLPDEVNKTNVINKPEAVKIASNKHTFFEAVQGVVSIPEWTLDAEVALGWVRNNEKVFARASLNGHGGDGITVLESEFDWDDFDHSDTKIYVKYIPKQDEYRVHVANGKVIDVQRKAIRRGLGGHLVNWNIRNAANGFVFVREGVNPNKDVLNQAVLAVESIGLDFGAVDVIWNNFRGRAFVLEVNTAPGLEGSSVENYAKFFSGNEEDLLWNGFQAQPVMVDEVADAQQLRVKFINQVLGVADAFPEPIAPRFDMGNHIDNEDNDEYDFDDFNYDDPDPAGDF